MAVTLMSKALLQHIQEAQQQGACLQLDPARANSWGVYCAAGPLDKQYTTTGAEMQGGTLELGGSAEAQVRHRKGEQQRSPRQGQEGMEEYGTATTTHRTLESHGLNAQGE